uniref:AbrB/MazE/SpoVT family DNA-binding domain-containing protein n=1 Tax=Paractinoplanes polyasparticus TaxID=2856853 RepID=UPI001C8492E7|nr:AbrB/MazE/SpoVT family DNA-binding domain-containing protein [Actinoplanes polyasparticus]
MGRLADRSPIIALGWRACQPVALTIGDEHLVVDRAVDGRRKLTGQGFLRLPAAIRHHYRIRTGDRLLVAACPDADRVIICTHAFLDAMLDEIVGRR